MMNIRRQLISPQLALVVMFSLPGCSNQALYEAIQQNRLQRCDEIPIPQQQDCRDQYQTSYEDYRRERDALP